MKSEKVKAFLAVKPDWSINIKGDGTGYVVAVPYRKDGKIARLTKNINTSDYSSGAVAKMNAVQIRDELVEDPRVQSYIEETYTSVDMETQHVPRKMKPKMDKSIPQIQGVFLHVGKNRKTKSCYVAICGFMGQGEKRLYVKLEGKNALNALTEVCEARKEKLGVPMPSPEIIQAAAKQVSIKAKEYV